MANDHRKLAEQKLLAVFGDARLSGTDFGAIAGYLFDGVLATNDEVAQALIARNLVSFAESIIASAIQSGEKDYSLWVAEAKEFFSQ